MKFRKFTVILLIAALVAAIGAPVAYAASNTVTISNAEDLKSLAIKCKLDSYSKGLTVVLNNDIDLQEEPIDPIGSFSGTFYGKGHKITGLRLASDGSYQGLFRFVRESGVISNLHVEGVIEPQTLKNSVGGIVGANYGQINGCSFNGTVRGLTNIGGIAGENYGIIKSCTASGTIIGKTGTGGINGYNEGTIDSCSNDAEVNTSIESNSVNIEDLDVSDINTLRLVKADDENTVSDSGGIAGYSSGIILNCKNNAAIGYQHFGYNVGGIAGRQCGYIEGSSNYGEILGKKDIGGICGQMEPYMILTQIESLIDELNALNSSLNYTMAHLGNNASEAGEVVGSIQTNANDAANNAVEMDKNSDDPQLPQNQEQEEKPSIDWGEVGEKTDDYVGGIKDQIGDETIGNIGSLPDGGELTDQDYENLIGAGGTVIGDGAGAIGDKIENKKEENDKKEQAYNQNQAALNSNMSSMASNVSRLNVLLGESMGDLASDMMGVNTHFAKVSLLVANLLSGNALTLEDISEFDSENVKDGKIFSCVNYGNASGDINIGGIGGDMGIEMQYDLEGTLLSKASEIELVRNSYETRCVARNCVNNGTVNAKKDYLGGIVGYQELGYIVCCTDYGEIVGENSTYVGGIAGYSATVIEKSQSMCDITGAKYVGGIVGYGYKIRECTTMINLTKTAASPGAIAGWADISLYDEGPDYINAKTPEEQEAAKEYYVYGNKYVHESLGAVDDLSYNNKAYGVQYSEMIRNSELPEAFRTLTLTFRADGQIVDEVNFVYGGSLKSDQIPEVPNKPGYTGYWPEQRYSNLHFSYVVDAMYVPNATALSSELARGETPMSVLLADGSFTNGSVLELTEYTSSIPNIEGGSILEIWQADITGNKAESDSYELRYLVPELSHKNNKLVIFVRNEDGSWVTVENKVNGSYAVFPAAGNEVIFCAAEYSSNNILEICLGAAAVAAIAVCFVVLRKKKKPVTASAEE